jgi:uncharacterized membrane protein
VADNRGNKSNALNLILLLIISAIVFGYIHTLNKSLIENLYYGYTDLIYFEQSLANFIHGHGLINTGRGEDRSLFCEHAYFTHFLISLPVYWLFPRTLTLYDLATIHMLAALIIVFYLAKRILKKTSLAWIGYFLLLINSQLIMCAGCFWTFGFHSEVYYLAYFLALIYFWEKNKGAAVLFFCLALLTKETYAIPLFMTMVYFSIKDRGKKKTPLVLAAVCLLYFVLVTNGIALCFGEGKIAYQYYGLHLDAGRAFDSLRFPKILFQYWKGLFTHFHFLPILSPQVLILALPNSLVNTLAEFTIGYSSPAHSYTWHSIPLLGFMIWAYLLSFDRLTKLIKNGILIGFLSLILMSFSVYLFLHSPIPERVQFRSDKNLLTAMKKVEQLTAGSDSLCVGRALAAPFMHKRHLYHFPVNCQKAEYVLCRPWERVLSKIPRTQYEVVLKRNRLILLRNLSYRRSVPPPDSRPHSAIFR